MHTLPAAACTPCTSHPITHAQNDNGNTSASSRHRAPHSAAASGLVRRCTRRSAPALLVYLHQQSHTVRGMAGTTRVPQAPEPRGRATHSPVAAGSAPAATHLPWGGPHTAETVSS